ncbi:PREDICTED: lysophospholipase-like protein 1 isoform X2 [Myotis brandtii]|uniref:lysophospholipase-like protein 1 isoform X2 n=1 Tax=Myotis brandtii TaxID=109478 RepID=UPI000703F5B2|nr:PREDICTED: lysophospholipase-like protein 1 isoform X2 [Myotis brandtii]
MGVSNLISHSLLFLSFSAIQCLDVILLLPTEGLRVGLTLYLRCSSHHPVDLSSHHSTTTRGTPGDSGQGLRRWIKQVLNQDLTFQHIKIIYPTAPARPYTPMKGGISNVWFDRFKISNDCPEHLESIDVMCQVLTDLINDEVKSGIKKNRILIGGFSMGGCMAMHVAYRNHQDVAGVFALSSFLNKTSAVYQALQKRDGALPELFQCHGTADELVLHSWGEETNSALQSLGPLNQSFLQGLLVLISWNMKFRNQDLDKFGARSKRRCDMRKVSSLLLFQIIQRQDW